MDESHSRTARFRVGRLSVALCADEESAEEIALAEREMEILGRLLRGLGSDEDKRTFVELLNGPTLDAHLDRGGAEPCGCRGKR